MTEDPAFGRSAGDVLGHEFAGEVVALGKGAEGIAVGDLVSVIPLASCGRCASCLRRRTGLVRPFRAAGRRLCRICADPAQPVRDPARIGEPRRRRDHRAARRRPPRRQHVGPQDRRPVLILGAGPIGLAVAFWARRMGAGTVVVQDVAPWQEERALAMGATAFVVDPEDPVGASDRALGGKPTSSSNASAFRA